MQARKTSTPRWLRQTRRIILLDLLSIIAGVIGGLGAVLFRYMIKFFRTIFFTHIHNGLSVLASPTTSFDWTLILLPALGGLLIGPIIARVAPETRGHGVPEVMEAVLTRGGRIRSRVALVKIFVSSITIGSGGSAGREGPIAQIGASIGSLIGRAAKLDPHCTRLLVTCGLSAGIAGTFNAPLGGAVFGMEILMRSIGPFDAIPVIFSSVIGAATASIFLGRQPSFIIPSIPKWAVSEIPIYILHGLLMGLIAVVWVRIFYAIEELFSRIPVNLSLKPALGGLLAGTLLAVFPEYGVGGVGYEGIDMALAGMLPVTLMLVLGVSKMLATSLTIGSGGSGGIFAPSLYIGAMLGGVLGHVYATLLQGPVTSETGYMLAGMAALFAGAAQAPLNVIIIIPEMSGSYSLIPPIMASAGTSFVVSWLLLRGSSIYTLKLERRGVKVRMFTSFILDSVRVEEVMTRKVVTIPANASLAVLETLFEENPYGGYPVVNEKGELVGIVTRSDLEKARHKLEPEEYKKTRVIDIASKNPEVAYPDETVREAIEKMKKKKISRLPVVSRDKPGMLVGIVATRDILKAYEVAVEREEKGVG